MYIILDEVSTWLHTWRAHSFFVVLQVCVFSISSASNGTYDYWHVNFRIISSSRINGRFQNGSTANMYFPVAFEAATEIKPRPSFQNLPTPEATLARIFVNARVPEKARHLSYSHHIGAILIEHNVSKSHLPTIQQSRGRCNKGATYQSM